MMQEARQVKRRTLRKKREGKETKYLTAGEERGGERSSSFSSHDDDGDDDVTLECISRCTLCVSCSSCRMIHDDFQSCYRRD